MNRNDMPLNYPPADPRYRDRWKRILDLMISVPGVVLAAVPMALTAAAVKLESKGPVLFRQKRLGLHGKEFEILKFRSMRVNSEFTGSGVYSSAGDSRVTRVGRFIRATSLDELPQLLNILRGDMSLIGPRPPLTYHPWPVGEYTEEQMRMFDVRPGITGWAQTHGRKDVEWHHRIELNVWYVDHVTFGLDLEIFFRTIFKVLANSDNVNRGETLAREPQEKSVEVIPKETRETAEKPDETRETAEKPEEIRETAEKPEEIRETADKQPGAEPDPHTGE